MVKDKTQTENNELCIDLIIYNIFIFSHKLSVEKLYNGYKKINANLRYHENTHFDLTGVNNMCVRVFLYKYKVCFSVARPQRVF